MNEEILLEILNELREIKEELRAFKNIYISTVGKKPLFATERYLTKFQNCNEAIDAILALHPDPIVVIEGDKLYVSSMQKLTVNDFVTLLKVKGKIGEDYEVYVGEDALKKLYDFCNTHSSSSSS